MQCIVFLITFTPIFLFYLAHKDVKSGKKPARKTTRAGGSEMDLKKIAQEQQVKLEKEREERKEQIKATKEAAAAEHSFEIPLAPASSKAPAKAKPKEQKDPQPSKTTKVDKPNKTFEDITLGL